jgi:protein-L-isoaspartate(D-aspartate) O-methyltransferase
VAVDGGCMRHAKSKFVQLSHVQRALQAAQTDVRAHSESSGSASVVSPVYSLAQPGTLRNVSVDWIAQPEVLIKARALMVEALRAAKLADEVVLGAMAQVPRHVFVDEAFYLRAYDDDALPIGFEQTISHPSTVARMLGLMRSGALRLGGACARVLEVGTGCGYQAAVLGCLVEQVFSIERVAPLYDLACVNLTRVAPVLRVQPTVRFGDGMLGWPDVGAFDGIVLAAAGMDVPRILLEQLRVGGVLVAPVVVGARGAQQLVRITRTAADVWRREDLDFVHFVPLLQGTRR